MGFEPTRAEHNGLAVHRLNHSATSSWNRRQNEQFDYTYIDAINMLLSQWDFDRLCYSYIKDELPFS